ncbi:hypothetical protein CGMCC3_g594 [Colletotrichum fructicola]|nr:uncharacterized protein CGMCC3_g594 [Colletotrichum fructicola]KAE9583508.1 hypothetical protein CGMCC3_g594 [Colletotrichum fructicola]
MSTFQSTSRLSISITNGPPFLNLTSTTQGVISVSSPPLTSVALTSAIINTEAVSGLISSKTDPDTGATSTSSSILAGDRATVTSSSAASPAESTPSTVQTLPTPTHSPPPLVNAFEYLGCFGGRGGPLPSFTLVRQVDDNDFDVCIAACNGSRFAGAFETECYCGDFLDSSVSILLPENECNSPCPGNLTQTCGGRGAPLVRRQDPNSRLTVYTRLDSGEANTTTSPMTTPGLSSTATITYSLISSVTNVDISSKTLGEVTTTQEPITESGTLVLPPNVYTNAGDVPAGAVCSTVTKSWVVGVTTLLPTISSLTNDCSSC